MFLIAVVQLFISLQYLVFLETMIPDKIFEKKWSNPVKNWTEKEKFGICFCVYFNSYLQSLSF